MRQITGRSRHSRVKQASFYTECEEFRTLHENIHVLVAGPLAKPFAGKVLGARERNARRYEDYILSGGLESGSTVSRNRSQLLTDNGIPMRDIARMNVAHDIAIIGNYTPTMFWLAYEIFSRPSLVEMLREEVKVAVGKGDGGEFVLDISILRTSCPLLLSTLQETQRLRTQLLLSRKVLKDIVITDGEQERLLKKGNLAQIPTLHILRDNEIWGEDSQVFEPSRFIKLKKPNHGVGVIPASDLPPLSFPVWGIAPHICPARWYATTGMMVQATLMLLRLDIEAEAELRGEGHNGQVWKPLRSDGKLRAVPSPTEPVPVRVKTRKDWEGKWVAIIGTPGTRLQLSVA
jgi:hypothetical protein